MEESEFEVKMVRKRVKNMRRKNGSGEEAIVVVFAWKIVATSIQVCTEKIVQKRHQRVTVLVEYLYALGV